MFRLAGPRAAHADPWIDLAVAVVQRAIDDTHGYRLGIADRRPGRPERIAAAARAWLLDEQACGLLDIFDIDPAALAGRLQAESRCKASEPERAQVNPSR